MQIPLSRPDIKKRDINAVLQVLRTPYLSIGPKVKEFEEKIAQYTGIRYVVAVNSGTSALHLIIRASGIKDGDEVITTPFSFISSANCILFERGKPVFVDIDPKTLNIDVKKIIKKLENLKKTEKLKQIKAILAVDVFGQPAEWDKLQEISQKYELKLIEDSAEAIGSEYKGKKAGTFGEAGIFAFYPNKQITTGEGGVLLTNNENIAKLTRSMRNQGRGESGAWLNHERLGYNYRMDELSAALGCAQMERINEILDKRTKVAQMYNERLRGIEEIEIPYVASYVSKMSWFVYVIKLKSNIDRDKVVFYLRKNGIECKPYFTPIHLQPFYRKMFGYKEGDFPVTENVAKRTIALPFFNNLKEEEIDYVCEKLRSAASHKS